MEEKKNEYGVFNYFLHLNEKNRLVKNEDDTEIEKYSNTILYFETTPEMKGDSCLKYLNYKCLFESFPWKSYLHLNKDLLCSGITNKEQAWYHWKNYGINEERTFSYINNSNLHQGRLGNIFFINLFLNFMSIKWNLRCSYKHESLFNELGIYFKKGKMLYRKNCLVTDDNFLIIFYNKKIEPCNLILKDVWFQTRDFCCILKMYFSNEKIKNKIIEKNAFKNRYNNNNDVFVHLRLGDVSQKTKSNQKYYDELLGELQYTNGFISSDSPDDPFFEELVNKYKLIVIEYDEIKTIMFASTCSKIILSGGTYSWLIGFLAFYAEYIFYPELENKWYGDIFSFSNWVKI